MPRFVMVVSVNGALGRCAYKMPCFRTKTTFVYSTLPQDEGDEDDVTFANEPVTKGKSAFKPTSAKPTGAKPNIASHQPRRGIYDDDDDEDEDEDLLFGLPAKK